MSTSRINIAPLLYPVIAMFFFSAYKPIDRDSFLQAKELMVSISLDSINPGPMTKDQLLSLKKLVVRSEGKVYTPKTYDFGIVPKSGPASFIKGFGSNLPSSASYWLQKTQPGDMIIITNLVLFGVDKYKAIAGPIWTVAANNK